MDVISDTQKKMQAAIDHLKQDLKGLRTGRANPSLVENVGVEVYGTRMRLLDMATISVPEPRMLVISPYDHSNIHAIAKAIESANLNIRAIVDGNVVRIKIPEMDASVRQDMVKQAKKKSEEAKISIRNVRQDGNKTIKKQKESGEIPEDIMKKNEKKIQELTDKFCKMADDLSSEKEKEIMTI